MNEVIIFRAINRAIHRTICRSLLVFSVLFLFAACASKTPMTPLTTDLDFTMSADTSSIKLSNQKFGLAAVNDGEFIYVLGGSGDELYGDIEIIKVDTNEVTVLRNKLMPRRYFSAVHDGQESIYIMGGMSNEKKGLWFTPIIEVFNTRTQTVTRISDFTMPTRMNAAVLHDNIIYLLGGDRPSDRGLVSTERVFAFNIDTQTWRSVADMPTAKATKAVVHEGYIYVVGGYNNKAAMNVFERFNIADNTWESLPSLPQAISANSIAVIGNKLFSFGDYEYLDLTLVYDFDTQQWQRVNLGLLPTRHAAATAVDNTIYVIGGTVSTRAGQIDLVQKFTIE